MSLLVIVSMVTEVVFKRRTIFYLPPQRPEFIDFKLREMFISML